MKYHNKLALANGVKCCTQRWTLYIGRLGEGEVRASQGASQGSGNLSIHMGGKDLQGRV